VADPGLSVHDVEPSPASSLVVSRGTSAAQRRKHRSTLLSFELEGDHTVGRAGADDETGDSGHAVPDLRPGQLVNASQDEPARGKQEHTARQRLCERDNHR